MEENAPYNIARGMAREPLELVIYMRQYCHLCHEMLEALEPITRQFSATVRSVDIDADPALEDRYGEWVPVLTHGTRELARHRLDVPDLLNYLHTLTR